MRGFICAMYTIAHIIQQQTVAVMTNVRCNRLVEGPLLKQILVHIEAMMPTTANIRDVTTKAMSDPNERDIRLELKFLEEEDDGGSSCQGPRFSQG
jgi:translation elongation factor EF-Ts